MKENFKSDIIDDLRPKVRIEPIKHVNDLKVYDKNELAKYNERNTVASLNKQPKNSNFIISQPVNIEPVDSNLFFNSSLLHAKQKQSESANGVKKYFTKDEFELTKSRKKFSENDSNDYISSSSPEKLNKKIRRKKKKSISKKSSSLDLNEKDVSNKRLHNAPSPPFISKEQPGKKAQHSSKIKQEDLDLLQNKSNTFRTPENKEPLCGNSINSTPIISNSVSSTSTPSFYSSSTAKLKNSILNSKSLKNNKNNKNNNRNNNENNTLNSHNNESFVDLPNIKSQDYDSNNRNLKVSNKQQQCLVEIESISKAGFNFNNNNNINLSETNNKPPSLPKNNELDKSEKNNEECNQSSLPILKEVTLNKPTTPLKTEEEAFLVPIKTSSAKKLSRKMKLINNLTENKSSLLSDTCNKNEGNINYTGSNNSALKFLNCLEKNKSKYDFGFITFLFKQLNPLKNRKLII